MVRVLVLNLCDSGSNPTFGSLFFFSFRFFFFFFFLSRIRDNCPERVNAHLFVVLVSETKIRHFKVKHRRGTELHVNEKEQGMGTDLVEPKALISNKC